MVGAGSFGTAVALVLERAGVRTTLLCRTAEQAQRMVAHRENERYLPGVRLPDRLKVRTLGGRDDQFHRADLVFVAVPSQGIDAAIAELTRQGVARHAGVVSLAKGLVPPDGKYTFDKLSSVFATGNATRDDAPNHIRIQEEVPLEIALMWRNMCPAHVYELPDEVLEELNKNGRDGLEGRTVDLQITPSNCIQCGAITAKGGRLTPPEGGDGPNYQIT